MPLGTIKKKCEKGFGFIQPSGSNEKELFFHASALIGITFDSIKEGANVEYSMDRARRACVPRTSRSRSEN